MEDGVKYSCSNGWQWIKNCFNFYDYSKNLQAYNALVEISNNREIVDFSSEDQIHKDLLRTFQTIDLFATPNMKNKLMRILKALVAYDKTIGYTQGMNFIAAG